LSGYWLSGYWLTGFSGNSAIPLKTENLGPKSLA